jgi:hypothetical protein
MPLLNLVVYAVLGLVIAYAVFECAAEEVRARRAQRRIERRLGGWWGDWE